MRNQPPETSHQKPRFMHLADHIRPLLRDHDCVIIPDFGGLVADVSPARAQPGRQALSPPTKLVAFNQALTRNDGLLVDAFSQHTGLSIAQAREAVRAAVAGLQRELDETNRTELPGIGIFRRAAGRGLAFEYTGTDNLLAAAFGLPELAARPVRATDSRPARPQPVLRGGAARRTRLARLLPAGVVAVVVSVLLLANYQVARTVGYLPASWQTPKWEWPSRRLAPTNSATEPQQATLAQHDFTPRRMTTEGMTPVEEPSSAPAVASLETPAAPTVTSEAVVPAVAEETPAAATIPAPTETVGKTPAPVAAATPAPAEAARPAAAKPTAPVPAAAAAAPTVVAKTAASAGPVTIKARTGRYYVVANTYSSLRAAETERRSLARNGHNARIILPFAGSRHFRVTAADYSDLPSARREAQRLRVSRHADFDTFKF